jgi:hypothetical protein
MSNLQVVKQEESEYQPIGMITPAGSINDAIEQFNLYQKMKQAIGRPEDFQQIRSKKTGEVKHHPKKSFVRKVQRFFNLSCEIIQDEPLYDREGNIIAWLAKARAIHTTTGAFQEGDGSCSFDEKYENQRSIHNIRSHATTRAKNRAILDLVGFGEVSAEEINEREYDHQPQQSYQQQPRQQYQTEPTQKRTLNGMATTPQKRAIYAAAKSKGLSDPEIKQIVVFYTSKESSDELTKQEASELIETFKTESAETLRKTIQAAKAETTQKQVYDVDPETGEVMQPNNSPVFTDEEIESALGGVR